MEKSHKFDATRSQEVVRTVKSRKKVKTQDHLEEFGQIARISTLTTELLVARISTLTTELFKLSDGSP